MTEGEMIKLYVEKEHINKAELTAALGLSEEELHQLYQSQTVDPDIKNKLKDHFNRNIFDGSLLTEYKMGVPDQQANKPKT
jgi:hypothetical protein